MKKKKRVISLKSLLVIGLLSTTLVLLLMNTSKRQIFIHRAQVNSETNYYVDSMSGSDQNSGTSQNAPWKSLEKVNTTNFVSGDTVNFKRNSIWNQTLNIKNSGIQGNPITFQAYGSGTAPTIDLTNGDGIIVSGNWNIVKDFLIKNVSENGVQVSGQYNVIRAIEIANAGAGVSVSGEHNLISHSYAHDLKMIKNDPGGNDDYGAIGFIISAHNNEIAYSRCVNCKGSSYDYGTDGGFVEVWQKGDNSYIHHNRATNTDGFFELGGEGAGTAHNIRVQYNILENTGSFLCAHSSDAFSIPSDNLSFDNNTVIDSYGILCATPPNLKIRNNIFSGKSGSSGTNYVHTNNIYTFQPENTLGSGEKVVNPQFVNAQQADYHLQNGSPAIDAGLSLGQTFDFENKTVPAGSAPDIGAFEFGGQTQPYISTTPKFECMGGANCVPTEPAPTNAVYLHNEPKKTTQYGFFELLFRLFLQLIKHSQTINQ